MVKTFGRKTEKKKIEKKKETQEQTQGVKHKSKRPSFCLGDNLESKFATVSGPVFDDTNAHVALSNTRGWLELLPVSVQKEILLELARNEGATEIGSEVGRPMKNENHNSKHPLGEI